jgi:hypothetical protein
VIELVAFYAGIICGYGIIFINVAIKNQQAYLNSLVKP